MDTQIMTLNN